MRSACQGAFAHRSLAYSALASFRMGMSGLASFRTSMTYCCIGDGVAITAAEYLFELPRFGQLLQKILVRWRLRRRGRDSRRLGLKLEGHYPSTPRLWTA